MAQHVIVQMVDDLDGTPSETVETVTFGLDGRSYEIDLNETNRETLREIISEYATKARRVGGRVRRGQKAVPASGGGRSRAETDAIRQWAKANGHDIADRGRIPGRVIEAYQAAHN
ncbi:MAG TPA: Lsr2 family protein [Pseudonocardiaceae bacterium]